MHAPGHTPTRTPGLGEILLLGSLTAFGAVTIDLYLPTLPDIARDFSVSPAGVQLTLSTFFVGMALGQLFYGPLSDRIGRRPAILIGCVVYVAASLACALAPSLGGLIAGRFVQALGCCAGIVVARAVVRDRYDHRDSARIFSLLTLVLAVAPMVAPTIGTWLARAFSWRAVFVVLAVFGLAVGLAIWRRLDESRSEATAATARSESVLASYLDLLKQRRLVGYVLVSAANGATLFSWIAAAPDLVIDIWGLSPDAFGLVFAGIAVGVIGASQVNRGLLKRMSPDAVLAPATLVGVVLGFVLLGMAGASLGMWWILAGLFCVLTTNGFIAANAVAGALNVDPLRAGATSGLLGSINFAFGALATAINAALHDGTPRPMSLAMAAAMTLAALACHGLALRKA